MERWAFHLGVTAVLPVEDLVEHSIVEYFADGMRHSDSRAVHPVKFRP